MTFDAGGTIVFSYTDGTDRWELRVPCADFDPVTFAYTGTGLKVPTEAGIAATVANFGGVWAPYFDPTWTLTLEALFHTSGGTGTRLGTLPSVADVTGTSSTPSSANPPLMRGFTFTLDNGKRQVVRFFSVATTTTGARREVTATSGGFDARDQALMAYLAGPSTGLVAWDGQIFPPTATAYQRYKLAPFERGGGGGGSSPPGDCITFPRGATICNDAADVVHVRTPGATHALDLTGYQLPGGHRLDEKSLLDPTSPLTLSPGTVGLFPAGTYTLCFTLGTIVGGVFQETAASPPATITVDGTQGIRACLPDDAYSVLSSLPLGSAAGIYLLPPVPPSPFLHPGELTGWYLGQCHDLPHTNTPDGPMPPATNEVGALAVRVRAPGGGDLVAHDGTTCTVYSAAVPVLQTPLATLGAAPDTLVGQDPATGLPAFCPPPTSTTLSLGGGGGSQPAPPTQCVQVRCGVSAVLRDHLMSLYDDWRGWLDPFFSVCATFGVAVAVATVPWDWIADLGLAAAGDAIKGTIVTLTQGFVGAITGNLLPPLDPDMKTHIQQAAFDALSCTGDQVQVSAAEITAWQTALAALTTWPLASLAGPFCGVLLQFTPLAAWQGAAATASPSHVCDLWS